MGPALHGHRRGRHALRTVAATGATVVSAATAAAAAAASGGGLGFSQIAAVALGYVVLAGSCVRSMPQIARMLKDKSAEGLSLLSNVSELLSYTVGQSLIPLNH